jgi:hypothetical protein
MFLGYNYQIMLKGLAIAVLFAIVLPIYGYEESPKADGGKNDSQNTQNQTVASDGTAKCIIKEEGTAIECRWPKNVPESKLRRLFSPENAPSIGLFFIGLGGVVAAGLTLRAINHQAAIMQRQIDIAINKERARIFVNRTPLDYSFLFDGHQREEDPTAGLSPTIDKFKIAIWNQGESKAYDVSCFCGVAVTNAEGHDLIRQQFEESIGIMEPNRPPIIHGIEFWPGLAEEILDAIRHETAKLRFYGWVRYENAFEPGKRIEVPFRWVWTIADEWIELYDGTGQSTDQSHWEDEARDQGEP